MFEECFRMYEDEFSDGLKGPVLEINTRKLGPEFSYLGLWFACDRAEDTYITTELYYQQPGSSKRLAVPSEVIKENAFRNSPRLSIPLTYERVWLALRVENGKPALFKAYKPLTEKAYVNVRVVKATSKGAEPLGTGVIKGASATFFKIGIEDRKGPADYDDTIMYLVAVHDMPPRDWHFDPKYLGVSKLPMLTSVFPVNIDKHYSAWYGQNPLDSTQK